MIEDKLHVVALRSEELGLHKVLDYNTLLSKMRSLDPNLQGMKCFTNHLAVRFQQLLCSGLSIKQSLAKIKQCSNVHINSLLYCESYAIQLNTPQYQGYITIYTCPAIPYIPSVRIILRYPTKSCLRHLETQFPNFIISKAEFTLDIKCSDSRALFEYIMRHIFMPHRRKGSLKAIGQHGLRVDMNLKTNHAFRISHLKIYERGPDSKRKKLDNGKYGWDASDIDRIRIEYDITNKIMREWGAKTTIIERGKRKLHLVKFSDFLNTPLDPKTYLNIMFKHIKNLKKGSIFLTTYFHMTNQEKRNVIDYTRLNKLKKELFKCVDKFTQTWTQDIGLPICKIENEALDIEEDESIFEERGQMNIEDLYTIRRREVFKHLEDEPLLIPLIMEAPLKIREYFPRSELVLDVLSDPEINTEPKLILFIRTNLSPHEAFNKLKILDEAWWLDASLRSDEKMLLHIEFI